MSVRKFLKALKALQKETGFSNNALAPYLGVPTSTLSCWVSRKRTPSQKSIDEVMETARENHGKLNNLVVGLENFLNN